MRNILKIALITIISLAVTGGKVNAAVLNSQFIIEKIKENLVKQINLNIKGKISVEVTSLPYTSIKVPSGNLQIETSLNSTYFTPQTLAKIDIIVDNKRIKTFGVPVKIHVYDNVWVAKDVIKIGETFSVSNISLEKKELGLLTNSASRENINIAGSLSRKNYKPGDIIDFRFIESVPVVVKNSPVSVVFQSQDITVTITAESLENGKIGDYVRVRSKQYKKDYVGRVTGINTVLVCI